MPEARPFDATMRPNLFPPLGAFSSAMMEMTDGHRIYVEQSGQVNGKPVIFLHGGPGGGCSPSMRRYFNPEIFRAILFDQRGCGKSTPFASVKNNTTQHLVADIERIRVRLGVEKWIVFGGSWGATLALLYAQAHPDRVEALVLRGVFTMTRSELDWFYNKGTAGGAGQFWPEAWQAFCEPIPLPEQKNMVAAYGRRIFGADQTCATKYAKAWTRWENTLAVIESDGNGASPPARFANAFARIENHYFNNDGFIAEGQIMRDIRKIAHIKGYIVQGRYDMICPPHTAHRLHRAWAGSEFRLVTAAGHAMSEPGIAQELLAVMDEIAQGPQQKGTP